MTGPALRALLRQIDIDEAVRRRAVVEAVSYARAETWRRRAQQWEDARPRPTDWPGRGTPEELAAADERCQAAAQACRNRAALIVAEEVFGDVA